METNMQPNDLDDLQNEQSTSQPSPADQPSPSTLPSPNKWVVWGGLIFAVIVVGTGILWFLSKNSKTSEQNIPASPPVKVRSALPEGDTILYTKVLSEQDALGRGWPTETIYRKVNNGEPEKLATVGKVGEYPTGYMLTPDKKFLLINLESKLQILDLASKELKDLLIPQEQVLSLMLSPDRTKLMVWDQKYIDGNNYLVHVIDLADYSTKIIAKGQFPDSTFVTGVWRDDNKVLLALGAGDVSLPYYFDLISKELRKIENVSNYGFTNDDGTAMAVPEKWVGDICNEFMGSDFSTYNIVEPLTGKMIDVLGDSTKATKLIEFSPDGNKLMFSTRSTAKIKTDCGKPQPQSYFIRDIVKKESSQISNFDQVLGRWDKSEKGVEMGYSAEDSSSKINSISLNGKKLATFQDEEIRFITFISTSQLAK